MEQNAFLQGGQRVDILHIGYAVGYRRDNRIDFFLRQCDQWQQRGRNDCGVCGNPVRWDDEHRFILVLQYFLCHVAENWGRKEASGFKCPANATQTFNKSDNHQRMTTELEELIVAANAIQPQQVLPNSRESCLQLALRCFIVMTGDCRLAGRG
ncbi:hypothetical protein V6917_21645 [Pectobacterium brasiliense]